MFAEILLVMVGVIAGIIGFLAFGAAESVWQEMVAAQACVIAAILIAGGFIVGSVRVYVGRLAEVVNKALARPPAAPATVSRFRVTGQHTESGLATELVLVARDAQAAAREARFKGVKVGSVENVGPA